MPDVCSSKSSMLTGRRSGIRSSTGRPDSSVLSTPNFMAAKEGNVLADGIIERDPSPIDKHHRRHAGDGLGNRADREAAVVGVAISTSRLPKHLKYTG